MINTMTVDQAIRELISHDCENDHTDMHDVFERIIDEIETPGDVGLVTMITTYLCSEFIRMQAPPDAVLFAMPKTDGELEHDNVPLLVAARLIACVVNGDTNTAIAVASAEMLDPQHAEEVLTALLQIAHDM